MKRLLPMTTLHMLLAAMLIALSGTPTAAWAEEKADLSAKTSLTRMPVVRMKADFEKHGNDYCNRVRREAMPYINMVCKALADTARFDADLRKSIATLESQLSAAATPARRYELWAMLYDKYSLLGLKPAYECAAQCLLLAEQMGDHDLCAQARLNKARLLTDCGFFREAAEELTAVDLSRCSKDTRVCYLVTAFNVEFEDGFYFPKRMLASNVFLERMRSYYAQTLQLVEPDSWIVDDMKAKMCFNDLKYVESVENSKRLIAKLSPDGDYYAYALGNMGYNYMGMGDYANAARCIAESAVREIRRGAKNYPALRKIAEVAYIMGDTPKSYLLINVAIHNAEIYNSRYRYAEIASSYPKIDKDMYAYTQRQKTRLMVGIGLLVAVALLLGGAIVVMLRQRRTLHRQKSLIEAQVKHLNEKNRQIETINDKLLEAGHIKEVVLGQLIVGSANHQASVEKMRKEVLRRLTIKDYDGLRNTFSTQTGTLFDTFYQTDQILLMLFPDFPEEFNALLRPECRVTPKRDERFTPEMRIFALIRLGITKNDDLARTLNYSVNTIKSYKTRVLNASPYSKEEFYERLTAEVSSTGKE